jgi:choline dehydrogenase-like flavoprotein
VKNLPGDVVVIGGGPAGITAANRLAAAGADVVLYEAGPSADDPRLRHPNFFAARRHGDAWWSGIHVRHTTAQPWRTYRQPRVFGGGASVNAMVCTPGNSDDWAWAPAATEFLGRVMSETLTHNPGPLGEAVLRGLPQSGIARSTSLHLLDGEGVALAPLWGLREGTDFCRRLLTLDPRVIAQLNCPVGDLTELADLENKTVVLAAGAIQSARLVRSLFLQTGGSGPATAAEIGNRLQDHPGIRFTVKLAPTAVHVDPRVSAATVIARWKSPGSLHPDLQLLVLDTISDNGTDDRHNDGHHICHHIGHDHPQPDRYGILMIALMAPTSRGSLTWDENDVAHLDQHLLSGEGDLRRLRAAVRDVVNFIEHGALHDVATGVFLDDRGTPLPSAGDPMFTDDGLLDDWLLEQCGDYSHVVGTLPAGQFVGTGDSLGKLIGYRSIWVADASIFPQIPTANTMIPTMAVADAVASAITASLY